MASIYNKGQEGKVSEADFLSFGLDFVGSQDDMLIFEKKDKPGRPVFVHYHLNSGLLRIRYDREAGFYAGIIAGMRIENKEELDFVMERIGFNAL